MRLTLPAVIFLALTATASAISTEELARIKDAAAATAEVARSRGAVNPDGSLARDGRGAITGAPASSANTANQLERIKQMYGLDDVSARSSPAAGGIAAGEVRERRHVDFQCGREEGRKKAAGGVSVLLSECYGTSFDAIQALKLSFCDAAVRGEVCTPDRFTPAAVLRAGGWTEVAPGLQAGFACNSAGACRVSVASTYSVSASGQNLAQQAQTAAVNQGRLAAGLRETKDSIAQSNLYETLGRTMSECVQGTNGALAGTDSLVTCGKTAAVELPEAVSGGQECEDRWVCEQEFTQTAVFSRSCVRTFPVTGWTCSWTVPTYECSVTQAAGADPVRTCPDGAPVQHGELVSATPKSCAESAAGGGCLVHAWTEAYAAPSQMVKSGECAAAPLAINGSAETSCAMGGAGVFRGCEEGGWWKRSLSENECTSSSADENGNEVLIALTEREKPGCGVCVRPVTEDTCRGVPTGQEPEDSCTHITSDPACDGSPASVAAESVLPSSVAGGFVVSQREEYVCRVSETSCGLRRRVSSCQGNPGGLTKGLDQLQQVVPSNQPVMNEALAGAAILNALAQSAEDCKNRGAGGASSLCAGGTGIRVFGGEDMRCRKPVGFLSGALSNDCCRIGLQRPGGGAPLNQCTLREAELASARRANLTQFIGAYCSKAKGIGKLKVCTQETQTYCAFPGILAKVIQQQGRAQLAKAVAGGVEGGGRLTLAFDYYSGQGGWTPTVATNGVLASAWQTPLACSTPAGAAGCPGALEQWLAVCDSSGGGCGDLPPTPAHGSDTWLLTRADPLLKTTLAVSSRASAEGACNTQTGKCLYELYVMPEGGGSVSVQRKLEFPVASSEDGTAYRVMLGATVIEPVLGPAEREAPRVVRLSTDGGASWTAITLPYRIQGALQLGASGSTVSGGCSAQSGLCQYLVAGSVAVTAKPWGPPQAPDCTGFTVDQLAALDFSRMDLSEWVGSVMNKLQIPDAGRLVSQAAADGQRYFDVYRRGAAPERTADMPVAANTAAVSPRQGWGPFTAVVRAGSNYPETYDDPLRNTDPIYGITVDWGDCTPPTQASLVDEQTDAGRARGFVAEHVYAQPDQIACPDRGPRNITHTVTIRITAKSGTYETTANVLNIWAGHKDPVGLNEGRGGKTVK